MGVIGFYGLMLLRRLGLAAGAWFAVHTLMLYVAYQVHLATTPAQPWVWDKPDVPYYAKIAWGAALIAFLMPRPQLHSTRAPEGKPA